MMCICACFLAACSYTYICFLPFLPLYAVQRHLVSMPQDFRLHMAGTFGSRLCWRRTTGLCPGRVYVHMDLCVWMCMYTHMLVCFSAPSARPSVCLPTSPASNRIGSGCGRLNGHHPHRHLPHSLLLLQLLLPPRVQPQPSL
jgi:hypothetical protein